MEKQRTTTGKNISRYSRLEAIDWYRHKFIESARVLVVGCGALGNEVIKNLALLGIGRLYLVDYDRVALENLSKCVLYREWDLDKFKVDVAAERVQEINPDVKVKALCCNFSDIGLGLVRRMDVVIGCVDSRLSRLNINKACYRVGVPWVDGGVDVFHGVASVFVPGKGACYECTLTDADYQVLDISYSCLQISRHRIEKSSNEGFLLTTPTTVSIIAALQVQEVVKLLHQFNEDTGYSYIYDGINYDCYKVKHSLKEDCFAHEYYDNIFETDLSSQATVGQLLALAQENLGGEAWLELDRELLLTLHCSRCGVTQRINACIPNFLSAELLRCPMCNNLRQPTLTHYITKTNDLCDLSLIQLGIPSLHIIKAKSKSGVCCFLELTKDLSQLDA